MVATLFQLIDIFEKVYYILHRQLSMCGGRKWIMKKFP